jgi:predicted DNA-binding transcriptional regulator YafY
MVITVARCFSQRSRLQTMPKVTVHNATARQWELLKSLPTRGPGITAAELTQRLQDAGFSVTKRSIERDLNGLSGLFGISCNDRSKPYGWLWMKDRSFDLPGVDFVDALSLVLVEDQLGKLAPSSLLRVLEPKFKQARQKLDSFPGNRYTQWTNRVRYVPPSLPFLPPKIEPRVLEMVQNAIVEERQLQVCYAAPDDARARERTLHPLAFIQHGPISYLLATAFSYTDPRLYALHRMISVQMTKEPSNRPDGFSLDAFLEQGGMQFGKSGMIRLKAEVSNKLACYLTESPLANDQELIARGKDRYVLTATIKDSWQLHFWILSQGAEITVVHPKDLRESIRGSLQAAVDGYRSP